MNPAGGGARPGEQVLLAGRYRLDRMVGRGGMAEVWAARDLVLDRDVAVKLLSSRFRDDEGFQRRFRREAQQAAQLNHPNVVKVYDTGHHQGLPFIVMELVRGRSLQEIVARGGLTEERALEVAAEVCSALAYAHERGLVHRDIKPGNILLDEQGTAKVTDFGIARAVDAGTVTQTAAVLGTAAYLSPEQAQGAAVDARSDLYSLGTVLYELLSGRQPFEGDSAVGVAYQHVQEDPLPPRAWDPTISPAAEAIAIKAMAKNPQNRYLTARQMRDDLLRAHAGQTVSAPAVLLPDETAVLDADIVTGSRPPRSPTQDRHRRTVGYVLLAALTVLAFAGGFWLLASLLGGEDVLTRAVPNLVGNTPAEAERTLAARGLSAEIAGEEYSDDIEEGRVIRQDPAAGGEVPDGTIVQLVLSRGIQPVTVPEVAGQAEEGAIASLRDAQLAVGDRITQFSDEVPRGQVIGTDPPAGQQVPKNSAVVLVVSAGQETELVPNVEGQLGSEARFILEERGFTVLVVSEYSDVVDRGRVIRQDPEAQTELPKGSEVTIVVSEGPQDPPSPSPDGSPDAEPSPTDTPTASESPGD